MEIPAPRQEECCQRALDARRRREFTFGDWATEKDSAAAFDLAVPTDLFVVYREVWGVLIQPRPAQADRRSEPDQGEQKKMRIDRVLVPTSRLLDLGWNFGVVGCELKRSGEKIGPAIAQAMDYSRSVFTLEPSRFRVWLDYVFIWPMEKQGSTIGSICAQQRIGSALSTRYCRFALKSGETSILDVQRDGRIRVGGVQAGAKVGSR